jgi:hypothetical protein
MAVAESTDLRRDAEEAGNRRLLLGLGISRLLDSLRLTPYPGPVRGQVTT